MVSRRLSRPWSLRPRRRKSASSCKGAITSVAEKTGKVFLTSGIEHLSISSRPLHRKQIGIRLHKPTFLWISGAREREREREKDNMDQRTKTLGGRIPFSVYFLKKYFVPIIIIIIIKEITLKAWKRSGCSRLRPWRIRRSWRS